MCKTNKKLAKNEVALDKIFGGGYNIRDVLYKEYMMRKGTKLFALLLVLSLLFSALAVVVSAVTAERSTLSQDQIINSSLAMKVGSMNALNKGTKITLTAAPYKDADGAVMVPLAPIASFTGKTPSGVSGTYIALNDVERLFSGYYVTYDESGLIYVSTYDNVVNRNDNEVLMYDIAKQFIYTGIDFRNIKNSKGEKLMISGYASGASSKPVSEYKSYINNRVSTFAGTDEFTTLYNLFKTNTNNFTHPYIKTTQARFDELNAAYIDTKNEDAELELYINDQIAYADKYITAWATVNGDNTVTLKNGQWVYDTEGKTNEGLRNDGWDTSNGGHSVAEMPYTSKHPSPITNNGGYGSGYDPAGGRLNVLSNGETCLAAALEPVALAYQITRDTKYLDFAYKWMTALCSWEHWGPGHFLNVANTARPMATAYDWLYNDFVRVYGQSAVDSLAKRIYENAIYEAEITLSGLYSEHQRALSARTDGDSSRYWNHTGNWNPVCTLGMLVASLAVMGEGTNDTEYKNDALYVIAASLGHYMERGMDYITLDGGYRESAGYWGAVYYMHMINKVVGDTAGTDFGLMDYPGIDTADYFGYQMEGSSYVSWNYHDDWEGSQPSNWYYLSAELYDNPEYAAIRYLQLHNENNPKAIHRFDLLYYDKATIDSVKDGGVELNLDYSMTSIDATVVHSSYEKNALFAGVMGGRNDVAHGQYDSGNWIYENAGVRWFSDLGADNYNLYGGGRNKGYYKYSAEGNNTLALTSDHTLLPHGQKLDAGGEIVSFSNNSFGSATVIDQNSVYAGKTEYARRGMLVTNNRRTFVIQDEVKTANNKAETFWWFAHYDSSKVVRVEISEDGRQATMWAPNPDGDFHTLRVTLLGDAGLKFQIMDTHTFKLNTPDANYSPNGNGISEHNRDRFMKLAVCAENVKELNMAVVVELITNSASSDVGYNYTPMNEWTVEEGDPVIPDSETVKYTVTYTNGTKEDFKSSNLFDGIGEKVGVNYYFKSNVSSVKFLSDLSFGDLQMLMRQGQNITFDLNGFMFYQPRDIVIGGYEAGKNTSLTINGGQWYSKGGRLQIRTGATLKLNDLDLTATDYPVRNEGGNLLINNSRVSAGTSGERGWLMYIAQNGNTTAANPSNLVINNSEISFADALINFAYGESGAGEEHYINTYILGNSKLSIPEYNPDKLVLFVGGAPTITVNFHVGDGTKLDFAGITLPENVNAEGVSRNYTLGYYTGMSVNNDGTVDVGTKMEAYTADVISSTVPLYRLSTTGDSKFAYVIEKVNPAFTAYYSNNTECDYYSSNIATAFASGTVNSLVLRSDANVATEIILGNNQQLVIDLSGHTLSATQRIMLGYGGSCKVTVKNGNYKKTSSNGFVVRAGTTLVFDNVNIDTTSHVAWDNGAKAIVFNNCESVNAKGELIFSRYAETNKVGGDYYHHVIINNSNVTVSGDGIMFGYHEMTADLNLVDLYVIGNSTVTYSEMFSFASNAVITETVHNLHIEDGSLVSCANFGLPESTAERTCNIYGYNSATLGEDYLIGECKQYPKVNIIKSGNWYTIECISLASEVKVTLTLYADFTLNFYLPVTDNVIDLVHINGASYPINENTEIFTDTDGKEYYKLALKSISADRAAEDINLSFFSGEYQDDRSFSVIRYFEILYSNDTYVSSYTLASSIIKYISTAYEYTNTAKPACLTNMLAYEKYVGYCPEEMTISSSSANVGNISVALDGAQLDLGTSSKFRFNLKHTFTGTIVINGRAYSVTDGICDDLNYINIEMRAFDMYDPEKSITISGSTQDGVEFSGNYDLRLYLAGVKNDMNANSKLRAMLSALYTYCTEAYSYKYETLVERPDLGNTPKLDVDLF